MYDQLGLPSLKSLCMHVQGVSKNLLESGNSTLLFHGLVLFFQVSDERRNKCSKDSFSQILQLS